MNAHGVVCQAITNRIVVNTALTAKSVTPLAQNTVKVVPPMPTALNAKLVTLDRHVTNVARKVVQDIYVNRRMDSAYMDACQVSMVNFAAPMECMAVNVT